VTLVFMMASVVWKNAVKSCVSHAVTGVTGCPNKTLPTAHVSLVVTVSILLVSRLN